MGRTRRRLLVLTGVVVVAAGGAAAWWLLRPAEASTTPVTVAAAVGTQQQSVSASGTIEPAAQADLNFAVSGAVTQVLVKEGDQVTTGQALATVDDTLLQAQLTAAQASLDAAEDKESASDDASTQAAVVSAESDVTAAQEAVDNATLTSTIDGTVVTVELKVGDRVSTGSSGGSGGNGSSNGSGSDTSTTQFTVVSTNTFIVAAKISSADVEQVKQDMAAEVTATGATEAVAGTVQTVGLVASADDSGAATFPVTIAVTGEQKNIYAGSSATVSIVVSERQDVLTVPALALHTDGDTTYVNKMVGGKAVRTDVKVGTTFGPQTEIVSGLKEGDEVELLTAAPAGGGGTRNGTGGNVFPGGGGGGGFIPGGGGGGFQGGGGR